MSTDASENAKTYRNTDVDTLVRHELHEHEHEHEDNTRSDKKTQKRTSRSKITNVYTNTK